MHRLEPIVRFWPLFAAGLDLLACLLASVHVLLHKRDSRAAALWIGFIWLLPLLGPVLYLALGVHSTFRRPVPDDLGEPEHAGAEHLQQLARVVSRVVAQPLAAGNRIEPLVNGDEAFPAMLAAIESAKTSVSLCTYIFDNDASGGKFVATLEPALQRGVQRVPLRLGLVQPLRYRSPNSRAHDRPACWRRPADALGGLQAQAAVPFLICSSR
jgi:cardiolipin synthase